MADNVVDVNLLVSMSVQSLLKLIADKKSIDFKSKTVVNIFSSQ